MNVLDATWLASSIVASAPLLLAASGELISERAGVLNIGLEGYILAGAFFGYWAEISSHSSGVALACGTGAGVVLAVAMGLACIQLGADQIVIGIGLVLLSAGVTSYVFDVRFSGGSTVSLQPMGKVRIPVLSQIPYLGGPMFDQSLLVYAAYLAMPLAAFLLYRTRWGLSVRAAGEAPAAAEASGIRVGAVRWQALLVAGGMGGLAGAYLSVGQLGFFVHGMSSGRGYLVLAAIFFGKWRVKGAVVGCAIFGAAQSLQLRLQGLPAVPGMVWSVLALVIVVHLAYSAIRRERRPLAPRVAEGALGVIAGGLALWSPSITLPSELWLGLPYALSLIVLAFSLGRSRMPSGLAVSPRSW